MKKRNVKFIAAFMTLVMLLTSFPLFAFATDESGVKPDDGTSQGRPFISGQPSDIYRIPGLVTLNDGTLVAVADARWTNGADGAGNDTIVARSSDNGINWDYTFTNYYPDNGNVTNKASTSVCDSSIATDGERLYLLTTFFPAGYATNKDSANNRPTPGAVAFDDNGRVKLKSINDGDSYNYYLGDFQSDGYAKIYSNAGAEVSGYRVDHDFYLYNNDKKEGNLFYSDSQYQTVKTNFLLFRTSDDKGKTWSDFTLVNAKNSSEDAYVVGPGRGVVTSDGTIIFGCYSWTADERLWGAIDLSDNTQRSSFIYLNPGSNKWKRMDNISQSWSSECQAVELENGIIRLFSRTDNSRIIYTDAQRNDDGTYSWLNGGNSTTLSRVDGTNLKICKNVQYSAIRYSKQLRFNGKYYNVMIVSSPLSEDSRANGGLTTLFLNDDNTVAHVVQHEFKEGFFAYSCLTELPDGRIACLYEASLDGKDIGFKIFDVEAISGCKPIGLPQTYSVDLIKGDKKTFFVEENKATNSDETVVGVSFDERYGSQAKTGDSAAFDGETIPLRDALYDFKYDPDAKMWNIGAQGVYLTIYQQGIPSTKEQKLINIKMNGDKFVFVDSSNEALHFYRSGDKKYTWDRTTAYGTEIGGQYDQDRDSTLFDVFRPAKVGEATSASDPVPGYIKVNNLTELSDGGQYLIGCQIDGVYYFLFPSLSSTNSYSHAVKCLGNYIPLGYYMNVDALKTGESTVVCGINTYHFSVTDFSREILGVVDYDPVIYTHGTAATSDMDHAFCGSFIADGSAPGEKVTEYRMNSSDYTIESVGAVGADGDYLANTDIKAENGKLTGTLDLATNASIYANFENGTYVTLKTVLRDSSGALYTQTDRLYVASNPVAGHVLLGNFNQSTLAGQKSSIQLATFVLAQGSYGNTIESRKPDVGYNVVAKHLYVYDNTDGLTGMRYKNKDTDITLTGADKKAGALDNWNKSDTLKNKKEVYQLTNNSLTQGTQLAYYYYDKSSPKNEGITVPDSSHPENFQITMSRQKIDVEYGADGQWDRTVTIGEPYNTDSTITAFMGNDTRRSIIKKLSGSGSITEYEYMFGKGTYKIYDENHQKDAVVQCSTTENGEEKVAPNTTTTLNGILRYQEGAEASNSRSASWNEIRLPFEIRMCDKSNERNAYNETFSTIRKSTTYTEESWKRYMEAALLYQEYLNNYTIMTTDEKRKYNHDSVDSNQTYTEAMEKANIDDFYKNITKRADFSELEKALEDNEFIYESGIDGSAITYTPDSYKDFVSAYEDGLNLTEQYDDEERKNLKGYVPGVDVDTTVEDNKLDIQKDIEAKADAIINRTPSPAGDDDAYAAASEVSHSIDKTAYTDKGNKIDEVITESDDTIYSEYNGKLYVNVKQNDQYVIDDCTKNLLEEMQVGNNSGQQVRKFHVTYTINGITVKTVEETEGTIDTPDYFYGTTAHIDLTQFNDADRFTVNCVINSGTKTPTSINLKDCGYYVPVLIQEDLSVDVTIVENQVETEDPAITVLDYFNTVIGTYNGSQITVDGDKITVFNSADEAVGEVLVQNSPKYAFKAWTANGQNLVSGKTYPVTEAIVIRQSGTPNLVSNIFTVSNGTMNSSTDPYKSSNVDYKLTLRSDTGKYWTRVVDGVETLASYAPTFTAFTSKEDVTFNAYDGIDALPSAIKSQVENAIPAVYGTGYFNNNKFTLSCDYSAPENVKILDAGIIYSTTAYSADTLVKGGDGAHVFASNNIKHWGDTTWNIENSGTFTMTKANSSTGVHYMRAYVSYTLTYVSVSPDGKTVQEIDVPYVAYGDKIYMCNDGVVSVVG